MNRIVAKRDLIENVAGRGELQAHVWCVHEKQKVSTTPLVSEFPGREGLGGSATLNKEERAQKEVKTYLLIFWICVIPLPPPPLSLHHLKSLPSRVSLHRLYSHIEAISRSAFYGLS